MLTESASTRLDLPFASTESVANGIDGALKNLPAAL
jgi:hypothetical protein